MGALRGGVTIGADIGQKHDPTAVAVAERELRVEDSGAETYHIIRHLERLPLGTPYPAVATRLREIVRGTHQQRVYVHRVYVDATGVGQPVVDLLAGSGAGAIGAPLRAVYFTYGDRRVEKEDKTISLGKAWLVSRVQALLQTGRILLPKTAESEVLAKELLDYEIRVTEDANDHYGAFSTGAHDDLVTALGLAVQLDMALGGSRIAWSAHPRQPWAGSAYDRAVAARDAVNSCRNGPVRPSLSGQQPQSDEARWGARRRPTGE